MGEITLEDCFSILDNVYKEDERPHLLKYNLVPASNASTGLLGMSKSLVLTVKSNDKVQELKYFVKMLPTGDQFYMSYVKATGGFLKEPRFYSKIVPMLELYIHEKVLPTCYMARTEEFIVLEDLSLQGYKTKDVRDCFDLGYIQAALESLASLHAASLACEEFSKARLDVMFPNLLFESLYAQSDSHPGHKHLLTGIRAIDMICHRYFGQVPREIVQEALKVMRSLPEMVQPSKTSRNTLSHGDLWCNNVMFRHRKSETSACIIDFQLMRYNPPAMDVLMLIHLTTSKELREECLDELLDVYYTSLSLKLEKSNLDINTILDRSAWDTSIEEVKPVALATTPLFLHYVLLPPKILDQVTNDPVQHQQFKLHNRNDIVQRVIEKDPIYRDRMITAIGDLLQYVIKHKM